MHQQAETAAHSWAPAAVLQLRDRSTQLGSLFPTNQIVQSSLPSKLLGHCTVRGRTYDSPPPLVLTSIHGHQIGAYEGQGNVHNYWYLVYIHAAKRKYIRERAQDFAYDLPRTTSKAKEFKERRLRSTPATSSRLIFIFSLQFLPHPICMIDLSLDIVITRHVSVPSDWSMQIATGCENFPHFLQN